MRARAALAAFGLLSGIGCAYYNGLYNANQLVRQAEKADREGRPGEARSLWARVIIKAESTLARYPASSYRDDALFLQGRGFAEVGACDRALEPLRAVVDSSSDASLIQHSRVWIAECQLGAAHPDSALEVLDVVVAGEPGPWSARARLLRGRAHLALGDPQSAIADLDSTGAPGAFYDRALALAQVGRAQDAVALMRSALDGSFDEARWSEVLDTLGRRAPGSESELVDSLLVSDQLTPGQRARAAIGDASRERGRGAPGPARARLVEAREAAPDSVEARIAQLRILEVDLSGATALDSVPALRAGFQRLAGQSGPVTTEAQAVADGLRQILEASSPGPNGDLRLFLAAERARDSLLAPGIARALFDAVAEGYPESVLAPKALIASGQVGRARQLYPDSPYVLALHGQAAERFRVLEDSLLQVIVALRESDGATPLIGDDGEPMADDDAAIIQRNRNRGAVP